MHSPPPLPFAPLIAAYLQRLPRHEVEYIAQVAIDALDHADGDTDLEGEWNEDEISSKPTWVILNDGPGCQIADAGGVCDEDGANTDLGRTLNERGAGCTISDPDCAVDDSGCDDTELELDEGYYDSPEPIRGGGSGDY